MEFLRQLKYSKPEIQVEFIPVAQSFHTLMVSIAALIIKEWKDNIRAYGSFSSVSEADRSSSTDQDHVRQCARNVSVAKSMLAQLLSLCAVRMPLRQVGDWHLGKVIVFARTA